MYPAIRKKLIQLAISAGIAMLIYLCGLSSSLSETLYSDGLYQLTSVVQRFISGIFPFALGDFLYVLLICYCLWSVINGFRKLLKKQQKKPVKTLVLLQLLNFTLIIYISFKLLWGLNYSRPSITERLAISDEKYNTKELVSLGSFLIDKVNGLKGRLGQDKKTRAYTISELESNAKIAYDQLKGRSPFFSYPAPAVKPVLFSWVISTIGIEGYYCPPSGEANVNMRLPAVVLPFVTCHEISHQLGIAREDEANLIGFLVSTHSPNLNFQYSGYYNILRSVLFEIRMKSPEDFKRLYTTINKGTLADFRTEREFWMRYNGDMSAYMDTALDKFLKMNNQPKGTDSYQDIVLWVYNLNKKNLTQK